MLREEVTEADIADIIRPAFCNGSFGFKNYGLA